MTYSVKEIFYKQQGDGTRVAIRSLLVDHREALSRGPSGRNDDTGAVRMQADRVIMLTKPFLIGYFSGAAVRDRSSRRTLNLKTSARHRGIATLSTFALHLLSGSQSFDEGALR
jgi:hypothetical protein